MRSAQQAPCLLRDALAGGRPGHEGLAGAPSPRRPRPQHRPPVGLPASLYLSKRVDFHSTRPAHGGRTTVGPHGENRGPPLPAPTELIATESQVARRFSNTALPGEVRIPCPARWWLGRSAGGAVPGDAYPRSIPDRERVPPPGEGHCHRGGTMAPYRWCPRWEYHDHHRQGGSTRSRGHPPGRT
jgi:hypothetical protein